MQRQKQLATTKAEKKNYNIIRILQFDTWNVHSTMEKIEFIANKLGKLNIDIAVLSEIKRKGNGTENTLKITSISIAESPKINEQEGEPLF